MKPQLSKISPIAGAKRVFGPSGLFNFAKGVGKLVIVAALLFFALWPDRELLVTSLTADPEMLLNMIKTLTLKLVGLTVIAMIVIAGLDYAFQRHSWKKRLRMTKDEIRRELKETEGDPQIKGRLRQLREGRMRKRMVAAVQDATVLIMNPTHYAVALGYEMGAEAAPTCLAKGLDDLALRMREAAKDHGVPVVENPPLARALYATVDVDEEIPLEHYEAVAKIIGFILKKAKAKPAN
jgi:flagellar biosynthetic protein FlhB